jgi:hypothetical protein
LPKSSKEAALQRPSSDKVLRGSRWWRCAVLSERKEGAREKLDEGGANELLRVGQWCFAEKELREGAQSSSVTTQRENGEEPRPD